MRPWSKLCSKCGEVYNIDNVGDTRPCPNCEGEEKSKPKKKFTVGIVRHVIEEFEIEADSEEEVRAMEYDSSKFPFGGGYVNKTWNNGEIYYVEEE